GSSVPRRWRWMWETSTSFCFAPCGRSARRMESGMDEDQPVTAEEAAEAGALARALDGESQAHAEAGGVGAGKGGARRAPPLGELAARRLIQRAAAEVATKKTRTRARRGWLAGAALAAAALLLLVTPRADRQRRALPARLCSRTAGLLVPGPFPDGQT